MGGGVLPQRPGLAGLVGEGTLLSLEGEDREGTWFNHTGLSQLLPHPQPSLRDWKSLSRVPS